ACGRTPSRVLRRVPSARRGAGPGSRPRTGRPARRGPSGRRIAGEGWGSARRASCRVPGLGQRRGRPHATARGGGLRGPARPPLVGRPDRPGPVGGRGGRLVRAVLRVPGVAPPACVQLPGPRRLLPPGGRAVGGLHHSRPHLIVFLNVVSVTAVFALPVSAAY